MKEVPFLYSRIEFRKNDAIKRRDKCPKHWNDWQFWDGKVSAYRSVLDLLRKGPRIPGSKPKAPIPNGGESK